MLTQHQKIEIAMINARAGNYKRFKRYKRVYLKRIQYSSYPDVKSMILLLMNSLRNSFYLNVKTYSSSDNTPSEI